MKLVFFLCLTCICIACRKNHQTIQDIEPRLSHVSGVGQLTYEGERLMSVGNNNLIYSSNGNLTGARIINIDTTIVTLPVYKPDGGLVYGAITKYSVIKESLQRYSFAKQGGLITGIMVDSFVTTSRTSPSNEPTFPSMEIYTNLPEAVYYYTGERLDSIEHLFPFNGNQVKKTIFNYDEAGNISMITDYFFRGETVGGGFPVLAPRKVVTSYEYDNFKNPWHWLYKKTGLILPGMPTHNISPNNPVKATTIFDFYGTQLTGNTVYHYTYQKNGYPLTMVATVEGGNSTETIFEY